MRRSSGAYLPGIVIGLLLTTAWVSADDPSPVATNAAPAASAPASAATAQIDELIQKGRAASRRWDYATAIDDFTNAIELQRYEPKGFFYRGMAYSKIGDFDHAIADFNRVILLNPKSANGYALRAEAYAGKGNREAAIADLDKAHTLPPNKQQTPAICARVERRLGLFDKARDDFSKVIEVIPENRTAYNNLAWLLATCPDATVRDGKKAVEVATKATQLSSSSWPYLIDTLACAYAETGDFDNAVKFENQFLEEAHIDPAANDPRNKLALFKAKKPYHETMEEATKASVIMPPRPPVAPGAPAPSASPDSNQEVWESLPRDGLFPVARTTCYLGGQRPQEAAGNYMSKSCFLFSMRTGTTSCPGYQF